MNAPPVQYVTTSDGYNLAYAVYGDGEPLVLVPNTFSHINAYWTQQTIWRAWFEGLAERFRVLQYDGRGQGMSTRGLPPTFSMADDELDLQTVVEHLHLAPFLLLASTWMAHTAVRFAVKYPERVRALILSSATVSTVWTRGMFNVLPSADWDLFLRIQVTGRSYTAEEFRTVLNRMKSSTTQADYSLRTNAYSGSTIEAVLPNLACPALVLQGRDYPWLSEEEPMKLAARIKGSTVALLEGSAPMVEASAGLAAIDAFVRELPRSAGAGVPAKDALHGLSARELEVLRLVAAGRSNQQIADELVISLNTVRRHVSNVFDKTGAANRVEAAAYARDHGIV